MGRSFCGISGAQRRGGAWCPGGVSTAEQRPSSSLLRQRPVFARGTVFISPRLRGACTAAWGEGCSSAAWAVRRTSAFWPCSGLLGASCLGWGRWHPCLGLAHLGVPDKYSGASPRRASLSFLTPRLSVAVLLQLHQPLLAGGGCRRINWGALSPVPCVWEGSTLRSRARPSRRPRAAPPALGAQRSAPATPGTGLTWPR